MGANDTVVIQPRAVTARRLAGHSTPGLRRPTNTARVETAMPLGERGYVNGSHSSNAWLAWDPFEQVPQLQWPEAVSVFLDMDNDDSRVTSLLESISLPILSAKWRIDPNGAPAEAVQLISRCLRVPVIGEDADDIVGVVHVKQAFALPASERTTVRAEDLAVAMEARCYRGGESRTRLRVMKYQTRDVLFGIAISLVCLAILLLRFWPG